jgi:hypothetical protein
MSHEKLTPDAPLTAAEEQALLDCGQWGERAGYESWVNLTKAIKTARDGIYPPNWHARVIRGGLFVEAGRSATDGMRLAAVRPA